MGKAPESEKGRIYITGASGLLGSALVETLGQKGYEVLTKRVEITDEKACRNFAAKEKKIDWIIHTAAMIDVAMCERNQAKCYEVNVLGTKNIREMAKKCGARVIYISTTSIFPGTTGDYKETDIPYPKNFYSLSKLLGEQITLEDDRNIVVRLTIVGIHPKGSRGRNFIEWLIDSAHKDKDLKLFTDVFFNPLSCQTLAKMISRVIELDLNDRYLHLGSKDRLSKADIGKNILSRFPDYKGTLSFVKITDASPSIDKPREMWLNTKYTEKKLGIPMPMLKSELEKIFATKKPD